MKIYLGLLLLVDCIQAQAPRRKGPTLQGVADPAQLVPGPQDNPAQQGLGPQDNSAQQGPGPQDNNAEQGMGGQGFPSVNFIGDNTQQDETTPSSVIPDRTVRPGTLRKRTRTPRPSMQTSTEASSETTDEGEYETTTQSEYALLTKNLTFNCSEHPPGFYANVQTGCRIWHYCFGAIRYDNICPIQTLFDQEFMTCVYATDTDCSKAPDFYDNNKKLYITTKKPGSVQKQKRRRPTTLQATMTTEQPSPDYEVDLTHSATLPRTKTS